MNPETEHLPFSSLQHVCLGFSRGKDSFISDFPIKAGVKAEGGRKSPSRIVAPLYKPADPQEVCLHWRRDKTVDVCCSDSELTHRHLNLMWIQGALCIVQLILCGAFLVWPSCLSLRKTYWLKHQSPLTINWNVLQTTVYLLGIVIFWVRSTWQNRTWTRLWFLNICSNLTWTLGYPLSSWHQ